MKFQLLIKIKCGIIVFLAFKLSDTVFIMLINDEMPTIIGIFNIYEHDKFQAQLSWAWKKFYKLGARFLLLYQNNFEPLPLSMDILTH